MRLSFEKTSAGHGGSRRDPRRHARGLGRSGSLQTPLTQSRGRRKGGVPEGYRVAEIYFERRGGRSIVGNIYKGRVDNVLPGLEAAFVDIGLDKNGFLHVDEIVLPGVEQAKRGRGGSGPRITDLLKPGQEIVVQVVKDPLKTKGARLSMELTIAGRYMVYAPTGEGVGVSRRLEDKERDRVRKEAKQLDLGGGGAIIRTAAHGATRADFERELQYLFKLNEVLMKRVADTPAPALVFQEADLSVRVVRDIFSAHFERAIVDDPGQHHRLVSFFTRTAPELVDRVELYDGSDGPLFEAYGVDPVINGMLERRVDLPSGGYLIIDYAEALTVIDVNTGSFTGKGKSARLEDTITKTNLEAADEVVRQLRLRDIGGIIVIDFIDMARSRNRDAVLKVLRKALDEDRTKTFVVEISPLGLVEMTRQNVTDGVREIMTKPCPICHGEGVVRSEETVAIETARHLRHMVKDDGGAEAYLLRLNPRVTGWFIADGARELHALEAGDRQVLPLRRLRGAAARLLRGDDGGHARGDRGALGAVPGGRGGPCRPRRAAHVQRGRRGRQGRRLPDRRAVNGVLFVGEKKLVRIEEAGRTIATAVLTGADAETAAEAARERAGGAREGTRGGAALRGGQEGRGQAARARGRGGGDARLRRAGDGGHRSRRGRRRRRGRLAPLAQPAAQAQRGSGRRGRGRDGRRGGRGRGRRRPHRGRAGGGAVGAAVAGRPRRSRPRMRSRPRDAVARGAARPRGAQAPRAALAQGGRRVEEAAVERRSPRRRPRPSAAVPASVPADAEAAVGGRRAASARTRWSPAPKRGRARKRPATADEEDRRAKPAPKRSPRVVPTTPSPRSRRTDGEDTDDEDDPLNSRPRRRGRRGGRRRSRAKAPADAEVTE